MSTEERSAAARYLGARGARATNAKLTPEQRATNARKAGKASAAKRWGTGWVDDIIEKGRRQCEARAAKPEAVGGMFSAGAQLEALAPAVGLKGAVVKIEQAPKPKRPLPKAGTNGARVIEVMTLMRAEGLEGINSVTIAMRAGFDRATTRAALAHLTTAGHVVSVPKPGSRREKLWRLA